MATLSTMSGNNQPTYGVARQDQVFPNEIMWDIFDFATRGSVVLSFPLSMGPKGVLQYMARQLPFGTKTNPMTIQLPDQLPEALKYYGPDVGIIKRSCHLGRMVIQHWEQHHDKPVFGRYSSYRTIPQSIPMDLNGTFFFIGEGPIEYAPRFRIWANLHQRPSFNYLPREEVLNVAVVFRVLDSEIEYHLWADALCSAFPNLRRLVLIIDPTHLSLTNRIDHFICAPGFRYPAPYQFELDPMAGIGGDALANRIKATQGPTYQEPTIMGESVWKRNPYLRMLAPAIINSFGECGFSVKLVKEHGNGRFQHNRGAEQTFYDEERAAWDAGSKPGSNSQALLNSFFDEIRSSDEFEDYREGKGHWDAVGPWIDPGNISIAWGPLDILPGEEGYGEEDDDDVMMEEGDAEDDAGDVDDEYSVDGDSTGDYEPDSYDIDDDN